MRKQSAGLSVSRQAAGNRLQQGANLLCHARRIGSGVVALANLVGQNTRTGRATGVLSALYATDKVDGWLARGASQLLRRPPTAAGQTLDQKVDKHAHAMVMGSHIVDAASRDEWVFGTVLLGNMGIQLWRDRVVNRRRARTQEVARLTNYKIDVGSIPASKEKMLFVAGSDIATQSPIAQYPLGRIALGAIHCVSSILSLTSGAEVISRLRTGTANAILSLPAHDARRIQSEALVEPTGPERALHIASAFLTHTPG